MMNKDQYQRYLQSPEWQATRARRIVIGGCRCEFRPIVGEHPKHGPWYGDRCTATDNLQVHHLHYDSIGAERDEDLEVLCRLHHLVRHCCNIACARCGEAVEVDEDEAIELVKEAIAGNGAHDIAPDEIIWRDLCSYCEHMTTKDD